MNRILNHVKSFYTKILQWLRPVKELEEIPTQYLLDALNNKDIQCLVDGVRDYLHKPPLKKRQKLDLYEGSDPFYTRHDRWFGIELDMRTEPVEPKLYCDLCGFIDCKCGLPGYPYSKDLSKGIT